MKSLISSSFSVAAQPPVNGIDHIENYYLCEATGKVPAVTDSRWKKLENGATPPVPTSAAPFLWHKYVMFFTNGSQLAPIIEFKGSLGKNGFDYDLVPSHSSIIRDEVGAVSPANITCQLVMRNADGSAQALTKVPDGYSVKVISDNTTSTYTLGAQIPTKTVNVITFVLSYGNIDIERHDIRVISEGTQGLPGRGIIAQEVKFMALAPRSSSEPIPATPAVPDDEKWNLWRPLNICGYSPEYPYLYKCVRTTFQDGNGNTTNEFLVEGPTVWGQDATMPFIVDIDNESVLVPVTADGKTYMDQSYSFNIRAFHGADDVTNACSISFGSSIPQGISLSGEMTANPIMSVKKGFIIPESFYFSFLVVHSDYGSKGIKFRVMTVKGGEKGDDAVIYQLLPSASQLSVARTDSGGFNPQKVDLSCGYTKTVGGKVVTVVDCIDSFDGYNLYYRLYNRTVGWGNYFLYTEYKANLQEISVYSVSKIEFVICKNTQPSIADVTDVIDRETIPIVADGLKGTSPFFVDIDKDISSVPLTSAGVAERAYEDLLRLRAFYGSDDITSEVTLLEAAISPTNNNIKVEYSDLSAIKVSVAKGVAVDPTTKITFTVRNQMHGIHTIVHTLIGVRAGADGDAAVIYELLPDLSQIAFTRDKFNELTPSSRSITFSIKKVNGDSVQILSVADSGLKLRYNYTSPPTSTSGTAFNGKLTVASSTLQSCVHVAAFLGSTVVDRETIPITRDGYNGEDGNGIGNVTYYRMFTMNFDAPDSDNINWVEGRSLSENNLSPENRYLWEKKETAYTQTLEIDTEIILVAQWNSSPCANLLENSAFLDENEMDAWIAHKGVIVSGASCGSQQNGWRWQYIEGKDESGLLSQIVFDGTCKKLKPNTWYTLSFYASVNDARQFSTRLSRIGNKSDALIPADEVPWIIDGVLVDGVVVSEEFETGGLSDGRVDWTLMGNMKRHYVTFKTIDFDVNSHDTFSVDFFSNWEDTTYTISMPKLEENTTATEWMEASEDRYATAYQHMYVGDWKPSEEKDLSTYYLYALGVRHVVRAKKAANGDHTFFRIVKRTPNTGYLSLTEPYMDTEHWERADYLKFIAADLLLSNEVITDKLTVSKIRGKDDKFTLDEEGNVKAVGGTFKQINVENSVVQCSRSPWVEYQSANEVYKPNSLSNDNIYSYRTYGQNVNNIKLPNGPENIGRVIRVTPASMLSVSSNSCLLEIYGNSEHPDNPYLFFEDGLQKTAIMLSNEMVELIGIGDDELVGYIVLRRIDINTSGRYGHDLKALAYGKVYYVPYREFLMEYSTFDGRGEVYNNSSGKLYMSYVGTGEYIMNLPSSWGGADNVIVMLTGIGRIKSSGGEKRADVCAPSVERYSTHAVKIWINTQNGLLSEGDFNFVIFARNSFASLDDQH